MPRVKAGSYSVNTAVPTTENERLLRKAALELSTSIGRVIGLPFTLRIIPEGLFFRGERRILQKLPAYAIAACPITYAQYQTFITAQDGFANPYWWRDLMVDDDHRRRPVPQRFRISNHPCERVSWYDAMAFCRWLSYRIDNADRRAHVESWRVRLPTEWEWEKAARGQDSRSYPWGDSFNSTKCNTAESGHRQTTPVGLYNSGMSPYGVSDMSGNVREWCLSSFKNPAATASDERIDSNQVRTVRGGSWYRNQESACITHRDCSFPDDRLVDLGFRIVCKL